MYNPLNEDYMFQEMSDRTAWIQVRHPRAHRESRQPVGGTTGPNRRWWRRAARPAR